MLWPLPVKAERVELDCTCHVTVVFRLPILFLYWVRVDQKGDGCPSRRHRAGRQVMTLVESITRRVG